MLDFLTAYLVKPIMQRQFSTNYSSEVDRYVTSKNPQTAADVEHWEKEYARKQTQGWSL
jgi:5S rRNA maturation endonuclease (ribonuclease M5)